MSRPADITYDDVKSACIQIEKLDQRPTVDRVHALLGKGGRNTVNRFIRQYLLERDQASKLNTSKIPPTVLVKIHESLELFTKEKGQQITALMREKEELKAYSQEILKESEKREDTLDTINIQFTAALAHNKELEALLKQSKNQIETLQNDAKSGVEFKEKYIEQKGRNDSIVEQIKDYKERINGLEKKNGELLERAIVAEKQ
ncbi:MAG: DNA-binding protein [Bacteriovoracaceae bacterium]|nr:DNA-binding protein [Bacteriovoracaceae bacterium]